MQTHHNHPRPSLDEPVRKGTISTLVDYEGSTIEQESIDLDELIYMGDACLCIMQ